MERHSNPINTPWWNKEKGSWLTDIVRAKENLKLSHGGSSKIYNKRDDIEIVNISF